MIKDIIIVLLISIFLALGGFARGFFWSCGKSKNLLRDFLITLGVSFFAITVIYFWAKLHTPKA